MHCYCHSAVVGGSVVCMCDFEQHDTCSNWGADPSQIVLDFQDV